MKLHEAIALRKGEIGRNKSRLTDIYKGFQKKDLFNGMAKSYEPLDEEGEKLPPESKRVVRNVSDDLRAMRESLVSLWDTVGSVEWGNSDARGNIEVDGETVMENVPVTALLFLENQLTDLRTTAEAIPTLSPDYAWKKDENDGLYKTDVVQTHRNVKNIKVITLVQQDEHHAGQATTVEEPKLAGYWNTVQHSGAMPATRKAVIVGRIEKMLDAVKSARARANMNDAPKVNTSAILDFIFA